MTEHEKNEVELKQERDFYEANKAEYLRLYKGKFVLIRDKELHGSFDSFDAAYNAGVDKFGNAPMLIRRVEEQDPTENIPAYYLGLLHGPLLSGT